MTRNSSYRPSAAAPSCAPPPCNILAKPHGNLAARFAKDNRGSTAIMFTLLIAPVMMLTGMAVDFSRMITVKTRMQTTLDAAALAGAKAAQMNTANAATVAQAAAQAYYNAAVAPFVVSKSLSSVSLDSSQTQFTWTSTSWIKTPFLNAAALIQNKATAADAPAGCQGGGWTCQKIVTATTTALSTGGNNTGYSIETSFMLDITGSMQGQKLTDLKAAANAAIDILIWSDQSKQTSKIAITPFAADVRLPTAAAFTAATGSAQANASKNVSGYTFKTKSTEFCVVERTGTNKYTDAAPSSGNYVMAEWLYSSNNSSVSCNVPASAAAQPLTTDKTVLHNLIAGLQANSSTAGHLGTAWAWYMLSPNWKSLWSTANQPADYDPAYNINTKHGDSTKVKLKKIAILMTDGDYNTEYTSQGIDDGYFYQSPANGYSSDQAAALCSAMKLDGKNIELYVVAFSAGGGLSNSAQTLLSNCATDASHFYNAETGDALMSAFRDIALKISTLRIAG